MSAGGGDVAAFEQLYRLTVAHVLHLALGVVRDHGTAEEVTQEVFIWVWRQAGRFDPTRGTALAWLACITRARSIDRVRSRTTARNREQSYVDTGPPPREDTTWLQVERIDDAELLAQAWRALTDRQREALALTYLSGLTGPEVSDRLGVPLGTAKARIRDGLIGLRRAAAAPEPVVT